MLIGLGALGAAQTAAQKAALVSFQQSNKGPFPMSPHGHPDANTLINQGIYDPLDLWPSSQVEYVTQGEEPGTFFRDLQGVNNQVPRWAWFTMGGVFLVLGGLAYRRHRKAKKKGKKK